VLLGDRLAHAFAHVHLQFVLVEVAHHDLVDAGPLFRLIAHHTTPTPLRLAFAVDRILEADTMFARALYLLSAALDLLALQITDEVALTRVCLRRLHQVVLRCLGH